MLSIVHTAEMQFRHESAVRDREIAVRAAIREREAALEADRLATVTAPHPVAAWPRPIGARHESLDCPAVA